MNVRYIPLSAELYKQNREKLYTNLPPNALVIVNSSDIQPTSGDGTRSFIQQSDFFWLTGIDQEESILVLFPDAPEEKYREMLFLKETSEHIRVWEGYKLTKDQATELSGIKSIHWLNEFQTIRHVLMGLCESVYLNSNEHPRAVVEVETREARFVKEMQNHFPLHTYKRLYPIMRDLRAIKSAEEIEQIQKACNITHRGFQKVLENLKPDMMEYEVEALMIGSFVSEGAKGFAYSPIVAGGANTCVLHYNDNCRQLKDGDLLLIDAAAEYGNYNSDLTRVLPVNGKFTPRQAAVYQAVLNVMKQATAMLVAGNNLPAYEKEVGKIMEQELIGLGLLDAAEVAKQNPEKPLYKKYFMHGTSHHLGLEVHDVGLRYRPMEAGMVFTVEPGIYIPEEGIGIRLENNVVVQAEGPPLDLMANIPLEIADIEAAMAR